ncbi:sensor histidine kinase [Leptolyngbya ohadii]|uniref:sensor histidine kinase n=1 Tax=Leptolyngbya ohadii TaxID=1962290 RepID=UPI0015C5F663|nr:PAS domain-containing sensor histidine kinase [Leptolyngbya ohadii]
MESQRGEDDLTQHLDIVHQRANRLSDAATRMEQTQRQEVEERVLELRKVLDELRDMEERLLQRNQQLSSAYQSAQDLCRQYQEVFDLAPDAYLITDCSGTIEAVNPTAVAVFRCHKDELLGRSLKSLVAPHHQETFQTKLRLVNPMRREREWEVCLQRPTGEWFDAAVTIAANRNESGEVDRLYWLVRDSTVRKQAEEQVREVQIQNVKLAESERVKQQFIATVSHELRTPMNAILGFSDLLLRRFHQQYDPQQINLIERIFNNGKHLLSLIEQMLDLTKLRDNSLQLNSQSFDLVELVLDAAKEIRPLATRKNLTLEVDVGEIPIPVTNDRIRLRQVIMNLLSNAVKFTNAGTVRIAAEKVSDDRVLITVSDTGIGIDPEHHSQIFREFWQIDQSLNRQYGGTGLGLAISAGLVKLMQGKITVESQLGQGAMFRVELPSQPKARLEVL